MHLHKHFFTLLIMLCTSLQAFTCELKYSHENSENMIRTTSENIIITDDGIYIVDPITSEIFEAEGIIRSESGIFALMSIKGINPKAWLVCGHHIGCRKCQGCNQPRCPFYCPGCR